jgi:hypothetical protein
VKVPLMVSLSKVPLLVISMDWDFPKLSPVLSASSFNILMKERKLYVDFICLADYAFHGILTKVVIFLQNFLSWYLFIYLFNFVFNGTGLHVCWASALLLEPCLLALVCFSYFSSLRW